MEIKVIGGDTVTYDSKHIDEEAIEQILNAEHIEVYFPNDDCMWDYTRNLIIHYVEDAAEIGIEYLRKLMDVLDHLNIPIDAYILYNEGECLEHVINTSSIYEASDAYLGEFPDTSDFIEYLYKIYDIDTLKEFKDYIDMERYIADHFYVYDGYYFYQ